jgi:hypothetical protein
MDMTQIDEQWIDLGQKLHKKDIVAISNTGKYRRADGSVGYFDRRHTVSYYGKKEYCSRIIAEHLLITVKRPDQTCIDHITHAPTEYSVNDVRNLRWCTIEENNHFEEAKYNRSKSLEGEKNHRWKGDNVGPSGAYKRARKLYKEGKLTEEEFQPYRDSLYEFRRNQRKMAKKTSFPI